MRRVLAIAVVLAGLLLPVCLYAQRGGAPRSFGRSPGFSRSYSAAPQARVAPRPAPYATSGSSYRRFSGFPRGRGRRYFGSWGAWPPVYSYWFPPLGYEYDEPDEAAPAPEGEQDDNGLSAQVDNLTAEVESLREEQALRGSRNAYLPAPPEEAPPAALLVYRDGRQVEVQNFAILGKTLWVFSGPRTQQIPLADLDLAATQRANGEQGVDFHAPATP
ncbi:MAG: hypothetical protein WAO35_29345 [Terriglobia bacterium]